MTITSICFTDGIAQPFCLVCNEKRTREGLDRVKLCAPLYGVDEWYQPICQECYDKLKAKYDDHQHHSS